MSYKLIVDTPDYASYEFIREEKNLNGTPRLYMSGPYMMAGDFNKNNRIYDPEEMDQEAQRYIKEMVETNRALGELNHPTTPDVNLERACHLVKNLKREGNVWIGKSLILDSPMGKIMQSLVNDGVSVGVSTRSLGKLLPESKGNRVKDMRLVAIDAVADPSYSKAFVNGILESKQWVLSESGEFVEAYERFEKSLKSLPRKDLDAYLCEQITKFIKSIK
jgi:hypothetical protein